MEKLVNRTKLHHSIYCILSLMILPGCLATRGWVQEQIAPIDSRLSSVESRMNNAESRLSTVEAKADQALAKFDNLKLERRFVLSLQDGATFAFDSDALSLDARRQIDGFLSDLDTTENVVFLVAGHTDSTGSEHYNFELGQKRADAVARYLMLHKGINPLQVTTTSYGASAPLGRNTTTEGRRKNRRVEILVYKEAITASAVSSPHAATY